MYSITLQFPTLDELLAALRKLDGAEVRPANTSEPAKAAPSHASEPAAKAARASKPAKPAPEPAPDPETAPNTPAAEAVLELEMGTYIRLKKGVMALAGSGRIADIKRLLREEFGGKPNFGYLDTKDPDVDEITRATELVEALLQENTDA